MRYGKKILKFVLPSLSLTPLIAVAGVISSCAEAKEVKDIEATKVNVFIENEETHKKTPLTDQVEFDIQKTKKIKLAATVEPAEANQNVTFKIVDQEGAGNIACSQKGVIYPNACVGTIKIKATSNTKNKKESDEFELVFYDSGRLQFQLVKSVDEQTKKEETYAYALVNPDIYTTIEEISIPSVYTDKDGKKYNVAGTSYSGFNACSKLWYVHLPQKNENFVYLGAYSFYQCNKIKKINIPDSITTIDVGAFKNCSSLEEVHLGSGVKYILSGAFQNCNSIEKINLPESLYIIGSSAFFGCGLIKTINIPKSVETIGESAFANCWSSKITVDKDNPKFIADEKALYTKDKNTGGIGDRILSCQYLYKPSSGAAYIVPDQIKQIDASAFEYCDKIENIKFTENSSCETIGENCFSLCTSLKSITLPKKITQIKNDMFAFCRNLNSITIPEQVQLIGRDAFYGCDSMVSAHFEGGNSNERYEWSVVSTAVTPELSVSWSTTFYPNDPDDSESTDQSEKDFINAYLLRTYGNWVNPSEQTSEWIGGYGNCVWIKNSVNLTIDSGLPGTFNGASYINKAQTTFKFKFTFNTDIPENTFVIYLNNDYGNLASNEVEFSGTAGQEKEFTLTLNSSKISIANQLKLMTKQKP